MANVYQPSEPRGGTPWRIIIPLVLIGLLVVVALLVVTNLGAIGTAISDGFTFLFDWDSRVNPDDVVVCRQDATCSTIQAFVFSLVVFFIVLTGFAYTTLLERVLIARLQQRSGPNRVGPFGLLQPLADGIKLIFKEDIIPAGAFRTVYLIAPLLKAVPTLIVIAVIPWGPDIVIPWFNGVWYRVPLGLADPNVGVLWLLAITSIGTYGVVLAGWASNNKYAMLGGLRATAQMLS
jgi:NADH:ubiquinone oxidoreductase subunit H